MEDNISQSELEPNKPLNWGLERRLQFIDFRLRWERKFNRTDLVNHFGISVPQASLDIAKYIELAADNIAYDRSLKIYVATENFKSIFARSSAQRYLAELLTTKMEIVEQSASFIGATPEVAWAPSPWRTINEKYVEIIVHAINEQMALRVCYCSLNTGDESLRLISPHALGYDGFRWHVRAFCHKDSKFKDFVIARILNIDSSEPSTVEPNEDKQWFNLLTLVIAPNPKLSQQKQKILELDYGMENGQAEIPCREAFLFYTLRRLGLHKEDDPNPNVQQIILKNREQIQSHINTAFSPTKHS